MKAKNLAYIILAAVVLTACESREDVFSHRNQTPEVLLSLSPEFPDTTATLELAMRFGEQRKVYFRINDDNLQDRENPFSASYTAQIVDAIAVDGGKADRLKKDLEVSVVENMVVLTSTTSERERLSSPVKYTVVLTCRDAYDVETQGIVTLLVSENRAPQVSVSHEPIDINDKYMGDDYTSGYGYKISALASVDPDGDEIVAYEYAFGGDNEVELTTESKEDNYGTGAAARYGTYIKATTLGEVYHVFQAAGPVKIFVRAKDSKGMWSAWDTTTFNIE